MRADNDRTRKATAGNLFPRSWFALCPGAAIFALISGAEAPAAAQTPPVQGELRSAPSYLDLSTGVWDIIGNAHRNETAAADAEFRFGRKLFHIGPAAGLIVNWRGGGMVYAGIYGDISLGPIVVTPLAGFGVWRRGGGKDEDLGGWFEFRTSLAAAYQFADRSRLGLRFGHISNADMHRKNPGENDLMLGYALPLDF